MAPLSDEGLVTWYQALRPLRVDLIGDFAGKELFAIHGEALLTHCISEANVSDQDGFQLVHAIHAVETFLNNLKRRGCQFHILWFSSHVSLCIPSKLSNAASGFHRLTRAILIKHLRHHPASNEITFEFPSAESVEFQDYTARTALRFFLCLDGLSFEGHVSPFAKWHLAFIHGIGTRGYSVALINNFEFKSSKAFTSVLSPSQDTAKFNIEMPPPLPRKDLIHLDELYKKSDSIDNWSPWDNLAPLTPRDAVSLTGLCNALLSDSSDAMKRCAAAYILHLSEMRRCSLSERPCAVVYPSPARRADLDTFFGCFTEICANIVEDLPTQENLDIFDLFDSRIIRQIFQNLPSLTPAAAVIAEARNFAERIHRLINVDVLELLPQTAGDGFAQHPMALDQAEHAVNSVMPFRHPILDNYLEPIHVVAEEGGGSAGSSKVFRELSHWHNAQKAIDPKSLPRPAGYHSRLKKQKLMADTIAYSASLTNSTGKIINPETIITDPRGSANSTRPNGKDSAASGQSSKPPRHESQTKYKKSSTKGGRSSALEQAQNIQRQKLDSKARDVMAAWDERCRQYQDEKDIAHRLNKVTIYLAGLSSDARSLIEAEIHLYICNTLISMILYERGDKDDKVKMVLFAKIWSAIMKVEKLPQSRESLRLLEKLARLLKIPIAVTVSDNQLLADRRLPFAEASTASISPPTEPLAFQLEHCGPFLERSFDSAPDPRVSNFDPDAWQRHVLDAIDADRSLFVVAPTSAGKTFISFYAMKRVLRGSDDGVLVYVAPTKALVNQIAAEVQARFSKSYAHRRDGGRSVWAIHTRDHRINNPTGCQVLVTVPHILQIMLLAPSNAEGGRSWSSRVKRIIFDEIHCIGQADDGVIWEQLLLLAPCPFIALSATVGNPLEFMRWLEASEKVKGRDMEMIVHSSRYSDLRKFWYRPAQKMFAFRGLLPVEDLATPGLDEGQAEARPFRFIHPIVSLTNRNRGTMEDIALEPRDCLYLWQSMSKHQNAEYPIDDALCPQKSLPAVVKRSDVLKWGDSLKRVLQSWMQDTKSPFSAVQNELAFPLFNAATNVSLETGAIDDFKVVFSVCDSKERLFTTALPLLTDLHTRGALPGILFNYDRDSCEATIIYLAAQLTKAEKNWKESSPEWARKMAEYTAWKTAKSRTQQSKTDIKKRPAKSRGQDDDKDKGKMSKLEMLQNELSVEASKWESFDPDAPLERFSFADPKKISDSELKPLIKRLVEANVQPKIVSALRRGVAVHHAGMNRNYRQIVEMLFRKGYLRVVVATGTLALGINMPCKTVVFFGDSVFLTPLNYHQGSGRAGRRGFDLLGNVVFAGLPLARALEVMSSRLPDLGGHFPLSTTLVVRLLGLAHHTKNSEYATRAINSVLSLSRLYLGGPSDQMAIRHHLRFSIEYLRRQQLLSKDGAPLNFAGLVGHLYFTENAVFAFHSLLKEGYFHRLCEAVDRNPEAVMLELVLVLSHLFCRIPLGIHSGLVRNLRSSSVITLPPLPAAAERVLRDHNQEALNIFRLYVSTFIKQHLEHVADTKLPFTGCEVKTQHKNGPDSPFMIVHLPPTRLRSPFAALSGFTDSFETIHELCTTVRSDVFLEESAVPYIPIYPIDTAGRPWNAYIYDFFKHGELTALVRDNKIKRGDVWFHLKDFSLVLATIVTSLENFVRLDGGTDDAAMADVQDAGDMMQERIEEFLLDGQPEEEPVVQTAPKQTKTVKAGKKKTKLDSWEDDSSDDDSASESAPASLLEEDGWQDSGDGNLPQVIKAFRLLQEEFEDKFRKVWA